MLNCPAHPPWTGGCHAIEDGQAQDGVMAVGMGEDREEAGGTIHNKEH